MKQGSNVLTARGLETSRNELLRQEGSQSKALNVNIDERGVITSRRGYNDYGTPTNGAEDAADITKQLMEYKDRIFRHYSSSLEFEDELGNFQPISGTFNQTASDARIKFQEANSNLYFTTNTGIKKISVANESNLSSTSTVNVLDAGAVKATYLEATTTPDIGGFLPAQSKVAYRYVLGYKDNSENLVIGSPSFRLVVANNNQSTTIPENSKITILDSSLVAYGDYVIINSLNVKYVYYFSDGSTSAPKKADTIGASFFEVDINTLNAAGGNEADIAAILANEVAVGSPEFEISLNSNVLDITSTEDGNLTDAAAGSGVNPAALTVSKVVDGSVTTGDNVNTNVTVIIPSDTNTNYFYQVYRTNLITTSLGLTLDEIDPGDEMNLVFEDAVTQADIDAGEVTFTDTAPESFRASQVPLYSNEITGEGILQSNDRPPIAQDIQLFRNSTFYANTKQVHNLEVDLVSVNDFESGLTRFVIGNSNITRFYTFIGTKEDVLVDVGTPANTADSSYLLIDSANNTKSYYAWFDKTGTSTDPNISGRVGIRVNLSNASTQQDIADAIYTAFVDIDEFNLETTTFPFSTGSTVAANQVRFLYNNNGETDGIDTATSIPATDIGTGWNITTTTVGTGELADTEEGGDVLLSGLVSVSQSIDETARSLVKIINKDTQSPVNAIYLSTSTDLPGKLRFESRTLEDTSFYIAIEDPRNNPNDGAYDPLVPILGDEFTPSIPNSKPIERLVGLGSTTRIQLTSHGYTTGTELFIGYQEDTGDLDARESFSGLFTITVVDANNYTIDLATDASFDSGGINPFDVSNSAIYTPDQVSSNEESVNRLYFSKFDEPEAVPFLNFINVGAKDQPIRRILALRDNLFVLKDDGVFIVSGTSAPNFSVRLIDSTNIIATDSAVVLNNQIYALTEQGISIITDSGVGVISRGIETTIDEVTTTIPTFAENTFGIAYENDRAFLLFLPKDSTDETSTQALRYNIFERTWTQWEYDATCAIVLQRDNKMYIGNGDRNYVSQERKNSNRTDYADRDFVKTIIDNTVTGNVIKVNSLTDIEISDAITQTQEVSIRYFNRLLNKIDVFDNELTKPASSTFSETFQAVAGDAMFEKIQDFNDYLVTLDPVNITAKVLTLNNFKTQMDLLIDELNDEDTITAIKTYRKSTTVTYETYITDIDVDDNTLTLKEARPFLEQDITVYKHIDKQVVWNPQHFGDPSMLKQVSYATIMFDQNNFNEAIARFGSDISQELTRVPFSGKGIGYWGDLAFASTDNYFGGQGNDIPFRTVVPRSKQKCRYLTMSFEHFNAREEFRIVGVSAQVRPISRRAYR